MLAHRATLQLTVYLAFFAEAVKSPRADIIVIELFFEQLPIDLFHRALQTFP